MLIDFTALVVRVHPDSFPGALVLQLGATHDLPAQVLVENARSLMGDLPSTPMLPRLQFDFTRRAIERGGYWVLDADSVGQPSESNDYVLSLESAHDVEGVFSAHARHLTVTLQAEPYMALDGRESLRWHVVLAQRSTCFEIALPLPDYSPTRRAPDLFGDRAPVPDTTDVEAIAEEVSPPALDAWTRLLEEEA